MVGGGGRLFEAGRLIITILYTLTDLFGGGHGGFRYCGIELFFTRYFGNFDFNVRYCGIIQPCGIRFFILLPNGIR